MMILCYDILYYFHLSTFTITHCVSLFHSFITTCFIIINSPWHTGNHISITVPLPALYSLTGVRLRFTV